MFSFVELPGDEKCQKNSNLAGSAKQDDLRALTSKTFVLFSLISLAMHDILTLQLMYLLFEKFDAVLTLLLITGLFYSMNDT